MQIKFSPRYAITPKIAKDLMRIESAKEKVSYLPLTVTVLHSLRETARLDTTHYSTMIEGNRLDSDQTEVVLKHKGHFPGRERDEREVKGYYTALKKVEQWVATEHTITEEMIQTLHALVMADGRTKVTPTPYRDGQNVIRDGTSRTIVYMPPEAKDVPDLMKSLIQWIDESKDIPSPLMAGIVHYQFATIHPYYDGNGRTARLLTTLILHLKGYGLKGLYSLEEYYARHLGSYYDALNIGESHHYYQVRAEADITKWVEYFVEGMVISFENIVKNMKASAMEKELDQSDILRTLDQRQRKALSLFQKFETVTSRQIGELFGVKPRTSAQICSTWVERDFLEVVDASNRGRKYRLTRRYEELVRKRIL
jgi:Fic family protein